MAMGWSFTLLVAVVIFSPVAFYLWFALDEILAHGGPPRSTR